VTLDVLEHDERAARHLAPIDFNAVAPAHQRPVGSVNWKTASSRGCSSSFWSWATGFAS
jgi:hypothetical protein